MKKFIYIPLALNTALLINLLAMQIVDKLTIRTGFLWKLYYVQNLLWLPVLMLIVSTILLLLRLPVRLKQGTFIVILVYFVLEFVFPSWVQCF